MAIITSIRNGMGSISEVSPGVFSTSGCQEDDLMQNSTDFVARDGVVNLTTDFIVSQRGAGANMSVDVSLGTAYVLNSSWTANNTSNTRYWRTVNDGTINAVIGANTSGSPRIDIVCILIDTAATPDANATNVASIVITAGTPGATPAVPATPANSFKLAEIAVSNGAASIVTANITDKRVSSQLDIGDGFNQGMSKQAIINGNFNIWQRMTTATNPASGSFVADKWGIGYANTGTLPTTIIHSKQALTAGDIPNSYNYYRISHNGAGTGFGVNDVYGIYQQIEHGVRFLCGLNRKVTVSFWARSSIANKRVGIQMWQNYGTGGSPSALDSNSNGSAFTLTSSWAKYTWTFTTTTITGKTFGTNNDDWLVFRLNLMWGATMGATRLGTSTAETFGGNGTTDIAQFKVNAGDTDVPYSPDIESLELIRCQRYAYFVDTIATNSIVGIGLATSTTAAFFYVKFPVTMRAQPAINATAVASDWQVSNVAGGVVDATSISLNTSFTTKDVGGVSIGVASGLTAGALCFLACDGTPNRLLGFIAEV